MIRIVKLALQPLHNIFLYFVSANCQSGLMCENSGFVAHNCRCMCPADLSGTTCNQVTTDTGKTLKAYILNLR